VEIRLIKAIDRISSLICMALVTFGKYAQEVMQYPNNPKDDYKERLAQTIILGLADIYQQDVRGELPQGERGDARMDN